MSDPDGTISTKRFKSNYDKNIKKPRENTGMLGNREFQERNGNCKREPDRNPEKYVIQKFLNH